MADTSSGIFRRRSTRGRRPSQMLCSKTLACAVSSWVVLFVVLRNGLILSEDFDATWIQELRPPGRQIDFLVPVQGHENEIRQLAQHIGRSSQSILGEVQIRLLITRYPGDDTSDPFRRSLITELGIGNKNGAVVFVTNNLGEPFVHDDASRALFSAACHDPYCVVTVVGLYIEIREDFLANALRVVRTGDPSVAYFPIHWAYFNPDSIRSVEHVLSQKISAMSRLRGMWATEEHVPFSISGPLAADLSQIRLDSKKNGSDFLALVKDQHRNITIVRVKEPGIIQHWYRRHCKSQAKNDRISFNHCILSRNRLFGSETNKLLKLLRPEFVDKIAAYRRSGRISVNETISMLSGDPDNFRRGIEKMTRRRPAEEIDFKDILAEHTPNAGEKARIKAANFLKDFIPHKRNSIETTKNRTFFIGVTSSRRYFSTRVAAIARTWGAPQHLSSNVRIVYFVGDPKDPSSLKYPSGSPEDLAFLAKEAGIQDKSNIVVLTGTNDAEYPPLIKGAAVLKRMKNIVGRSYDWIMDIDDDAYLNVTRLENLVRRKNPSKHQYIGHRCRGNRTIFDESESEKPYCSGGPGFLLSKKTLNVLAGHIDECHSQTIAMGDIPIHEDWYVGLCIYRHTGLGCWDKNYKYDVFLQLFREQARDKKLHLNAVSVHAIKEPKKMEEYYAMMTGQRPWKYDPHWATT